MFRPHSFSICWRLRRQKAQQQLGTTFFAMPYGAKAAAGAATVTNFRRCFATTTTTSTMNVPMKLHTEFLPGATKKEEDDRGYSILFLHGLLGNGRNLKTFARNVVKQQQSAGGGCWGGVLMDLRGHGKSYGAEVSGSSTSSTSTLGASGQKRGFTFQHCVRDVEHTLQFLSLEQQEEKGNSSSASSLAPTRVVVGHSWGGRLALEYAVAASKNIDMPPLEALWLLDTVPGQAHESVDQVIAAVSDILWNQEQQQASKLDRNELVKTLTQTHGMDLGVAQWLASSYNSKTGDFGFDLNLVQDLKPEFANQDFVGLLRIILEENKTNVDRTPTKVHLVRGGKNAAWSVQLLSELEALARKFPKTFHMHVLPSAGHWVHVDDLPGLMELFARHS